MRNYYLAVAIGVSSGRYMLAKIISPDYLNYLLTSVAKSEYAEATILRQVRRLEV